MFSSAYRKGARMVGGPLDMRVLFMFCGRGLEPVGG